MKGNPKSEFFKLRHEIIQKNLAVNLGFKCLKFRENLEVK